MRRVFRLGITLSPPGNQFVNVGIREVNPRRTHYARLNVCEVIQLIPSVNGNLRVECYGAGPFTPVET